MFASNRSQIRCAVVAVPVSHNRWSEQHVRARDLLPWADPYVVQLIQKLQEEVRIERLAKLRPRRAAPTAVAAWELDPCAVDNDVETAPAVDDLELPWYEPQSDNDPSDGDRSRDAGDESDEALLGR